MNKMAKMLLISGRQGAGPMREEGRAERQPGMRSEPRYDMEGRRPGRMAYSGAGMSYGGDMAYSGMGYEMENRTRDRRGREHYDNGRFAPMKNAYGAYNGGDDDDESMRMGGMEDTFRAEEMRRRPMNRIGFALGGEGDSSPTEFDHEYRMDGGYSAASEMERHGGSGYSQGKASAGGVAPFNKELAEKWMQGLKNADGSKGPHWTMEQAKQVMAQKGISLDPVQFWAALNAVYSDYSEVFRKHGAGDKLDFYVDMAKAFVQDTDAMPEKLSRYYEYVVKK